MKKRVIALLCAFSMLVTMSPLRSFAEEGEPGPAKLELSESLLEFKSTDEAPRSAEVEITRNETTELVQRWEIECNPTGVIEGSVELITPEDGEETESRLVLTISLLNDATPSEDEVAVTIKAYGTSESAEPEGEPEEILLAEAELTVIYHAPETPPDPPDPEAPELSVSPSALSFYAGLPGEQNATVTVTLTDVDDQVARLEAEASVPEITSVLGERVEDEWTLTVTAAANMTATDSTPHSVTITALDAEGKVLCTETIAVTIAAAPGVPVISIQGVPDDFYIDSPETEVSVQIMDGNEPPFAITSVAVESTDIDEDILAIVKSNGDEDFTLTLKPKSTGAVTVTITATNAKGLTSSENFSITVKNALTAPTFGEILPININEDEPTSVDLTPYIHADDFPDYSLSIEEGGVKFGTASIEENDDGKACLLSFTPESNYYSTPDQEDTYGAATVVLSYKKFGQTHTIMAKVYFIIASVEDAPEAGDFEIEWSADKPLIIPIDKTDSADRFLLENSSTVELAGLQYVTIGEAVHSESTYPGTLEYNADYEEKGPHLIYTPNIRYAGTVTATFTVKNADGDQTDNANLVITIVRGDNVAPTITGFPETKTVNEDTEPVTFIVTVTDPDMITWGADVLSVTSSNEKIIKNENITIVENESLRETDSRTYTVKAALESDAYTSIRYGTITLTATAKDDREGERSVVCDLTVEGVNDAPELSLLTEQLSSSDNAAEINGDTSAYALRMNEDSTVELPFEILDIDFPLDTGKNILESCKPTVTFDDSGHKVFAEDGIYFERTAVDEAKTKLSYTLHLKPLPDANTEQDAYRKSPVNVTLQYTDGDVTKEITIAVTVSQVNDKPIAEDDKSFAAQKKNVTVTYDVLKNDFDADGMETLTISFAESEGVTTGSTTKGGTVKVVEAGEEGKKRPQIEYTPKLNFSGTDSFTYYIIDDGNPALRDSATVTIVVEYVNYKPEVLGLKAEYHINEDAQDQRIEFTVADDETSAQDITVTVGVQSGAELLKSCRVGVDEQDPAMRYILISGAADKNSYDGKTAKLRLTVSDGGVQTVVDTEIYIDPVNDAPKAGALTLSYDEGGEVCDIAASKILEKCTDVDIKEGDKLYLIEATLNGTGKGSLTLDKETITEPEDFDAITALHYTPPTPYFDENVTINYAIRDSAGETSSATLTLTANKKNDAPVILPHADRNPEDGIIYATTNEDEPYVLTLYFKDAETALKDLIISLGSGDTNVIPNGSLELEYIGLPDDETDDMASFECGAKITIKPRKDAFSEENIRIVIGIADRTNLVEQVIMLKVMPQPDAPVTPDREESTRESTPVSLDLLEECSDPDPDDVMTLKAVTLKSAIGFDGTSIALSELTDSFGFESNGKFTFTPPTGVVGVVTFTYTVEDQSDKDGISRRSSGTLTIYVGEEGIGPSLKRLPPIVAYAGQTLPTYTLETKNISTVSGEYSISVAVFGSVVDGKSLKLDGKTLPQTFTPTETNPIHSLTFDLKPDTIGTGTIRFTISGQMEKDGSMVETVNTMSFTVTTHAENQPPLMDAVVVIDEPYAEALNRVIEFDVIDLANIVDPENEVISFGVVSGEGMKTDNINGTDNDNVQVVQKDGRYILQYNIRGYRNARKPNDVVLTYSVFDAGGAQGVTRDAEGNPTTEIKGQIKFSIKSENHKPAAYGFYMIGEWADATTIQIPRERWFGPAYDVDDDTPYLNAVRLVETEPTASVTFDAGENIILTPGDLSGWVTVQYQVKSQFMDDTSATVDESGFYNIYLYIPPYGGPTGHIPPRASGNSYGREEDNLTAAIKEDSTELYAGEITTYKGYFRQDITGLLFGDGSPLNTDVEIELISFAENNPERAPGEHIKIADAAVEKVTVDGKHRYYLYYKLAENGNSYLDGNGDLTTTTSHPAIVYQIYYDGGGGNTTKDDPTYSAKGTIRIHISSVNDAPVIEDESFVIDYKQVENGSIVDKTTTATLDSNTGKITAAITVQRGQENSMRFKVTDPDYPTQTKCDKNISLLVSSSNNLVVAGTQIQKIAPEAGDEGFWTLNFQGFLPGETTLTIKAYDESGEISCTIGEIAVTVVGENRPPVAFDHYAVFDEDTKASVKVAYEDGTEQDSDPDGDPVSIVILSTAAELQAYGGVRAEGDTIIFSPLNNFAHGASYSTNNGVKLDGVAPPYTLTDTNEWIAIRYQLVDSVSGDQQGKSKEKTLYLHFNPINDAPTFVGLARKQTINEEDRSTVERENYEGQIISFTIRDIDSLVNEGDIDDFTFMLSIPDNDPVIKAVEIVSKTWLANGDYLVKVKVTPALYASHGLDGATKLTVTVNDGDGGETTETIDIQVLDINNPPQLKGKSDDPLGTPLYTLPLSVELDGTKKLETEEDTAKTVDVLSYYIDPDGDDLRISAVSTAAKTKHGTVENRQENGRDVLVFTPDKDFNTEDYCKQNPDNGNPWNGYAYFTYTITDGVDTVEGQVYLYVSPVNDAPRPTARTYPLEEDHVLDITNLFTPDSYSASAPVWDVDNAITELGLVGVGYVDDTTSLEGTTLGVSGVTKSGGKVEIVTTKHNDTDYAWHIRYTPVEDFNGADVFYYQVSDGALMAWQKITVNVSAVNDPPRANFENSETWEVLENGRHVAMEADDIPVWIFYERTESTAPASAFHYAAWDPDDRSAAVNTTAVLTALDPDAGPTNCKTLAELLPQSSVGYGSDADGSTITMTPNLNRYGGFRINVNVFDGSLTSTYEILVIVLPVNTAPVITGGNTSFTTLEDTAHSGQLRATDVETAADKLEFAYDPKDGDLTRGTVTVSKDGKFTYTPTADYFGSDFFYIKVTDAGAYENKPENTEWKVGEAPLSDSVRVDVTITPQNDAPAAPATLTTVGDKAHFNGTDAIVVHWPGASDTFNETKTANLAYELGYSVNGGSVTALSSGTDYTLTGNATEGWTASIPNLTSGRNENALRIHVRTKDDGKSYAHTGDTASETPAETGTALNSAWIATNPLKVDSTAPGVSIVTDPTTKTKDDVTLIITADKGNAAGASEIAKVEVAGVSNPLTASGDGKYRHTVTANGNYTITVTDVMGNVSVKTITVALIDRLKPGATVDATHVNDKDIRETPYITFTFDDLTDANNVASGVDVTEYKLVPTGDNASDMNWTTYPGSGGITFPGKGSYTVYTRTVDKAGNENVETFGPYTVKNAPPVLDADAKNQTVTLYEETVGALLNSRSVSFPATDADSDSLTYSILEKGDYSTFAQYVTVTQAPTGTFTLTHKGTHAPTVNAPLTLTVRVSDGALYEDTTLTVTLTRINEPPTAPTDFAVSSGTLKTHYRDGDGMTLQWTAASDEETAASALAYELEFQNESGKLTPIPDVTGNATTNVTLQTADAQNLYNGSFSIRMRATDDNGSVLKDLNPDGSTRTSLSSGWVSVGPFYLDNTPPVMSHEIVSLSDTTAQITITATESSEAWQSGVASLKALDNGVTLERVGDTGFQYRCTVPTDGSYHFEAYDAAGNRTEHTVSAGAPGAPTAISYTPLWVKEGDTIAVSWEPVADCTYQLEVTDPADPTKWVTVLADTNKTTHSYQVPVGAVDTDEMKFRVRTLNADKLPSQSWCEGENIVCDSTPPVITLSLSTEDYTNQNVTVSAVVTDNLSRLVYVNPTGSGSPAPSAGSPLDRFETTYVVEENGTVTVTATDKCGNKTTESIDVTNIDKLVPTIVISAVSNGTVLQPNDEPNYPIEYTVTYDDTGVSGLSARRWAVTATETPPAQSDAAWQESETDVAELEYGALGCYYIHTYVADQAGNSYTQSFGPLTIVSTPPQVRDVLVTVPEGGSVSFRLDGWDDDPTDGVAHYLLESLPSIGTLKKKDEPDGTLEQSVNGSYTYTHDGSEPEGKLIFHYHAVDLRGIEGRPANVIITVTPVNDPPLIVPEDDTPQKMLWNESEIFFFDVQDPDDKLSDLRVSFSSDRATVVPLSGLSEQRTADPSDDYSGKLALQVTPLPGAYEEETPIVITVTVRDAKGLTSTAQMELLVMRGPIAPTVKGQYFFLVEGGKVTGSVNAEMGHLGTDLSYAFAPPGMLEKWDFRSDASDGSFEFEAKDGFHDPDVAPVEVAVTVYQTCEGDVTLDATCILYFCSEAITFEETASDELVTIVPVVKELTPEAIRAATIESSDTSLLTPESCHLELDKDTGELSLYYSHEEYRYGELTVTVAVGGETIEIPIVIYPVNNAPELQFTGKAEAIPTPDPDPDVTGFRATETKPTARTFALLNATPRSTPDASVNEAITLRPGQMLSANVKPDDAFDNQPNEDKSKRFSESYECEIFGYEVWSAPQNGELKLETDGAFTYQPDADYLGADSFTILVSEAKGFEDNQNPETLGAGVLDVSEPNEPRLGRMLTLNVTVEPEPTGNTGSSGSSGGSVVAKPEALFTDDHFAYIIGYADGTVRPEGSLTRAEAATVFFRLLHDDVRAANRSGGNSFPDVNAGAWYHTAVTVSANAGLINGYPNGSFAPDGSITRAELAAIAARVARMQGLSAGQSVSFTDIDGHWAADDIRYAAQVGFIAGMGDGTFRPDEKITRAQFITMVNRMTGRNLHHAEDTASLPLQSWRDCDPDGWYYLDVIEAAHSHLYQKRAEPAATQEDERWLELRETPDWRALEVASGNG